MHDADEEAQGGGGGGRAGAVYVRFQVPYMGHSRETDDIGFRLLSVDLRSGFQPVRAKSLGKVDGTGIGTLRAMPYQRSQSLRAPEDPHSMTLAGSRR